MPIYNNNGFSMSFGDRLKEMWDKQRALSLLVLLNVGLFVILKLVALVMWLFNLGDANATVDGVVALPALWTDFKARFWTVLSYMFFHDNVWQLLFNLWLIVFSGRLLMQTADEGHAVATYIGGGLLGAVFFLASYKLFPVLATRASSDMVMGASASALAMLAAATLMNPNHEMRIFFIGSINIKWVLAAIVAIDLLSFTASVPGECVNHAGGVAFGLVYALALKKGWGIGVGFGKENKEYTPYEEVRDRGRERPVSDEEFNRQRAENDKEVDAILDKLSKFGYSGLTDEEKRILFEQSKK